MGISLRSDRKINPQNAKCRFTKTPAPVANYSAEGSHITRCIHLTRPQSKRFGSGDSIFQALFDKTLKVVIVYKHYKKCSTTANQINVPKLGKSPIGKRKLRLYLCWILFAAAQYRPRNKSHLFVCGTNLLYSPMLVQLIMHAQRTVMRHAERRRASIHEYLLDRNIVNKKGWRNFWFVFETFKVSTIPNSKTFENKIFHHPMLGSTVPNVKNKEWMKNCQNCSIHLCKNPDFDWRRHSPPWRTNMGGETSGPHWKL